MLLHFFKLTFSHHFQLNYEHQAEHNKDRVTLPQPNH